MCGTTRLLVPAFLVGLAAATLLGNDLSGWIAAGVTVMVLAAVQKVRGTSPTCAIAPPVAVDNGVDADPGASRTDLPPS